ncbi:MAG: response regulator [Candidatus Rokuibacteriota bacterium]|jgi:CheY-like chemotaxis protein|nr:response regulator [Patescibacteria group bacterium]
MSSDDQGAPPRSILIIEDNADARDALRLLLELDGHVVDAAGEGAEGVQIAQAKDPDIALVDIGLPGLDGYEVARRLRASGSRRPVLVALTGYGQPEDRRRAVEAGFDALLVKPVDPSMLASLLTTLEIPGPGSRG